MVGDAAGGGGALFEDAHAGRGFARIEDAATRAGYGIGKLAGERGDAAEALQEVERYAFALKQAAGVAIDRGDGFAGAAEIAIALQQRDAIEDFTEHFGSGEDERLARDECAARAAVFGNAGAGGDVARADVFLERDADDFAHRQPSFSSCAL